MILPAAAESLSDFCANFPSTAKSRPPGVKFPENRRIDGPPFILPAVFGAGPAPCKLSAWFDSVKIDK
jgi:hypothetical protein